jgi:hypothetical protein
MLTDDGARRGVKSSGEGAKDRYGRPADVYLRFSGEYQRFDATLGKTRGKGTRG